MSSSSPIPSEDQLREQLRRAIWDYARDGENGNFSKIQECIDRGAPLTGGGEHCPALVTALAAHRLDVVTFLLEKGADPNEFYEHRTPLSFLIDPGSIDPNETNERMTQLAEALLKHGANPGLETRDRCTNRTADEVFTPLWLAVHSDHHPTNGVIGALIDAAERTNTSLGYIYHHLFDHILKNCPPDRIRQLIRMKAIDLKHERSFPDPKYHHYDSEAFQRYTYLDEILLNSAPSLIDFALEHTELTKERREYHLSMAFYFACDRGDRGRAMFLLSLGANISRSFRLYNDNDQTLKFIIEICPPSHREDTDRKGYRFLWKLHSTLQVCDNMPDEFHKLAPLAIECGFEPTLFDQGEESVTTRAQDFSRVLALADVSAHKTGVVELEPDADPIFLFRNLPPVLQSMVVERAAKAPSIFSLIQEHQAPSGQHASHCFDHLRKNLTGIKERLQQQREWDQSFQELKDAHQALIEHSMPKKFRQVKTPRFKTGFFTIFHGGRTSDFKNVLNQVFDPRDYLSLINHQLAFFPKEVIPQHEIRPLPQYLLALMGRLNQPFKRHAWQGKKGYYDLLKELQKQIREWLTQHDVDPVAQQVHSL